MNLNSFLQQLKLSNITLVRDGDSLKVQAPKGALTEELRKGLAAYKQELLAMLKGSVADDGVPLPQCIPDPDNLYEPFPLSDLQLGFYMADDPYMEFHVRPHYYSERDRTSFDVERYEKAWNKALTRHRAEIVVVESDGTVSTVRNVEPIRCKIIDLRPCNEQEMEESLLATRQEMMRGELPLDSWPWLDLRISLWLEQGVEHARIHYNHNNFFWDGYGTHRLLEEVDRYYLEPEQKLPPITLSYRDAVTALEQLAASPQGQKARQYWEERLSSLPGPPELPTVPDMNRRTRSRLHRREGFINAGEWSVFKEHARRFGLTPSNALFTTYAEIISAWSNSRHFVLSNMMTRRLQIHPDIKEILGNFASLYPLEIDFRANGSFVDRARVIQEQVIQDARYLQWGGMQVMQAYNRQQGGFGQAPIPFVIGSGLFMEKFKRADFSCLETSQVMLDHQFWELDDGRLYYVWDILEEFFPNGLVNDMWEAYEGLIRRLASEKTLWEQEVISVIPLRQQEERQLHVLKEDEDTSHRLDDLLKNSSIQFSDYPALLTLGGTATYSDLAKECEKFADRLYALGVRAGDIVAVVADRDFMLLKSVHAILRLGAAYVPIDPSLPYERRAYLLENSDAKYAVTQSKYHRQLEWPEATQVVVIEGILPEEPSAPNSSTQRKGTAGDLAYIIYTSGSTGQPKGVMIDHQGAMNTIQDINERFQIGPEDRIFGVSSFGFDLSVYDLFGAAASGAGLVYPEPNQALNPAHWLDCIQEHKATLWNSAPPLAQLFVEVAEFRGVQLPDLRLFMLSGDWIPLELPDRLRRVAPNAKIVSLGGATEASIWSILYEIGDIQPTWKSIPYGFPMKNQSWRILDDLGRDVPEWTTGELYILGSGLAQGYWKDAEKTHNSFVYHPFTGERMYRTGDLGRYIPGGCIEFLGRRDTQVKIQGYRIELGEIETCLTQMAGIQGAVVTVQKRPTGQPQLVAHIVLTSGVELDTEDIRKHLLSRLPAYMVPRLYHFLDRLPLSANGKIDRKALPVIEECTSVIPVKEEREPKDELEVLLVDIWREVLKQEHVKVTDDFFDLGGQSFEAVRIVGLIQEKWGAILSLGDIWQGRTIAALADRLRGGQPASAECLVEIKRHGTGNPVFLVHPAGGHVMCYRELAALLNVPIYAFQAPGVEGHATPLESITELAQTYVRSIQDVQPEGAVILGGWSSGGLIAYEAAVQLRQLGRSVGGVFIIDSPAPLNHDPITEDLLLDWFIGDMDLESSVYEKLGRTDLSMHSEQERIGYMAELIGSDPSQLYTIYTVFRGIVQGSRSYYAQATDLNLLILRARQGVVREFAQHPHTNQMDWGWKSFTSGQVEGAYLDGSHYTLLTSPQVEPLAECLGRWLGEMAKRNRSVSAKLGGPSSRAKGNGCELHQERDGVQLWKL